ncbi:MAG: citrate transporter [Clostridia bacterium]|nr:citrate transporter [Clostridia bacterium]
MYGEIIAAHTRGRGLAFIKKNAVMFIALAAAVITSVIVPPDAAYAGYFDYKTLTCLFCVLAVVCALRNINFFYILALRLVRRFKNARLCILALVYITLIGSMLIANDMALITFLPLGYFVLEATGGNKYMAFTFIMQNIAANLGGMLTPFGNPQNLYIYTKYNIDSLEFMRIMAPPFLASIILITLCCVIFIKPEKFTIKSGDMKFDRRRAAAYLALFALAILIVFRGIPYLLGLIIIVAALMFLDRKALSDVDYGLLFTFVFFFIFAGNMARIDAVREFFSFMLEKNAMIFSALSCQVISNVPTAILLSQFTNDYAELLWGVNIGGAGTLIASLASLITFREYVSRNRGKTAAYIGLFSALNFGFLIVLLLFMTFIKTLI